MDIINYNKAFKLFLKQLGKVLGTFVAICSVAGLVCALSDFKLSASIEYWIHYIIIVLLLVLVISLLLLVKELIKREIADKTNINIPDQLLDIVSKLPKEGSEVLSEAIDRYFHLFGFHEKRIELGNLLNENRDIKTQVSNLIDKLGWAYHLENKTDLAISCITQGVELAKEHCLYYFVAKGERHLAGIEKHRGNEATFLQHMNQSKEYTEKIDDIKEKNEMEGSLHLADAKYFLKKKDLAKAEEEAKAAMQKFSNDSQRQLKVYVVLGNIYLERQQWDNAYNMFIIGYDKSKGIRSDERAKNAMGLAKIHLKHEIPRFFKKEKAKEYLIEAESLKSSLKQHEKNELDSLMKLVK